MDHFIRGIIVSKTLITLKTILHLSIDNYYKQSQFNLCVILINKDKNANFNSTIMSKNKIASLKFLVNTSGWK